MITNQSLFAIPEDKIDQLQKQLLEIPQIGPPIIKELESLKKSYPKSVYIDFHLYRVMNSLNTAKKKTTYLKRLKKKFPNELVVKYIEAHNFLKDIDLAKPRSLKGPIPKKKVFSI